MFKAIVLVCYIAPQLPIEQCTLFVDEWGPYVTQENCDVRVNQMGREIYTMLAPLVITTSMEGACIPEEGELS
jgi:hypothetical protein